VEAGYAETGKRDPAGRRLRVLLSAYACEPGKGSEPGVGWNWAVQAARYHEVCVLTRASNRPAIDSEFESRPLPHLSFEYFDLPRWMRFWKRGERGVRLYYLLWQLGALRVTRRLHRQATFDVVHHVTFNTMDGPGFLWLLDAPFVWGPVGGGQEPSPALRGDFGRERVREGIRLLRKRLARFNPLLRTALRRAAAVLVANGDTERRLVRLGAKSCVRELETAVALPSLTRSGPASATDRRFTILWAGNLIRLKGPLLALDALATLKARGVAFQSVFVGGGPLRSEIEARVRSLGLEQEIRLAGRVSHQEMGLAYDQSHVLLFTSLRDTSGNVVLEAMAHSLPVVALDQHGVRDMLDTMSGTKVAIHDRSQVVRDLAAALEQLALDPDLRRAQGNAGRRRVELVYQWDHKGELLRQLYGSLSSAPAPWPTPSGPAHPDVAR